MSEAKDDGGSAFPLPLGSETTEGTQGLSLRDYFAAKALVGIEASQGRNQDYMHINQIAERAYDLADAMLEARKQ